MTLVEMTKHYKLSLSRQQIRTYNHFRASPNFNSLSNLQVLNIALTPDQRRKVRKINSKQK